MQPSSPSHEYENTAYHARLAAKAAAKPPPPQPAPRRRTRDGSDRSHRESTVVDGRLVQPDSARQTPKGRDDQASLVSEVLDAEVTALTNSSSPGSASDKDNADTLEAHKIVSKVRDKLTGSSSSGIASKNDSQQMLLQTSSKIST